jgi:CheY-like chemotaxis protein/uncharacterized protein YbcI
MESKLLKKVKLLLVEDDDIQRKELSTYLKRRFDKVYTAENGQDALEKYKTLKPDIIVTDLRMPKMDGLDFARNIRKSNRLIPIVIITAMNDKETILDSVDIGITNYIVKPVQLDALLEILEESVKTLLEINQKDFEMMIEPSKINLMKNDLTKYIKTESGKGPLDIRLRMHANQCFITVVESMTLYEKKLITNEKNIPLVNHNRNIFFRDRASQLEEVIRTHLEINMTLIDVKSDALADEVLLTFELV